LNTLVARFDHASRLGRSVTASAAVAEVLTRPCFDVLERVSCFRLDRQCRYAPKTQDLIAEYLAQRPNESIVIDNGRKGDLIAKTLLETGHSDHGSYGLPAPFRSYVVVPMDTAAVNAVVDSCCEIAVALQAAAGSITVEASFGDAESYALSMPRSRPTSGIEGEAAVNRSRERAAHFHYDRDIHKRVAAPEWGLFLSENHLRLLPLDVIRQRSVFKIVRELVPNRLVFIQLTDNPETALQSDVDELYGKARRDLEPILMDPLRLA
jgi:hypothetical protein